LDGSWYFIGIGIVIWLFYPVIIMLFNLKPLILGPLNLPFYIFMVMIISQTFTSFWERGYPLKDLILAQALFSVFSRFTPRL
jgi:cellulose synthase (UDP-forming)